jgi:hypothetical protein
MLWLFAPESMIWGNHAHHNFLASCISGEEGRARREEEHKGRGRRGRGTMDCPNKGEEITE